MRKQKKTELLLLAFALCFAVAVCFAFVLASRDKPDVPVINDVTTDTDTVITTLPTATDAPTEEITDPPTEEVTTEVVTTEAVTTAPPPVEKVISFLACGDNLLYRPNTFEADERANYGLNP